MITPRMLAGLRALARGENVPGQPTRQRLAKDGLAEFVAAPDADAVVLYLLRPADRPMRLTARGLSVLGLARGGSNG